MPDGPRRAELGFTALADVRKKTRETLPSLLDFPFSAADNTAVGLMRENANVR